MAKKKIVIVDDDEFMLDSLLQIISTPNTQVQGFRKASEALNSVADGSATVLITDMRMPEMDGLELLEKSHRLDQKLPIIMMTAFATIETAVSAMKKGAFDYVIKPFKADEIELIVQRAIAHRDLLAENEYLKSELAKKFQLADFVGKSPAMQVVFEQIRQAAPTSATVFIRGESGTGKELVARSIHIQSPRRNKPLIRVNCAALSAGVLESELFGHERGAFTGADRRRIGRFEIADGGTLFLDEVSEMDLNLQGKLLRVLQEKEFERVGSSETISVDVRILASSNSNLEESIANGEFREDLFYRLNVLSVNLPPLRERKEDIKYLTEFFLEKYKREEGGNVKTITPEAIHALESYDWAGNVRELANIIERVIVLGKTDTITLQDIENNLITTSRNKNSGNLSTANSSSFSPTTLETVEREHIIRMLKYFSGARAKTAEALGISERSLRDRLKRWQDAGLIKDEDL